MVFEFEFGKVSYAPKECAAMDLALQMRVRVVGLSIGFQI